MQAIFISIGKRIDLFVLLLCLGLTYGVWQLGIKRDTTDIDLVERTTIQIHDEIYNEVSHVFHYVNGVVGLYESSDTVSEQDLSNFLKVLNRNNHHPTLLRIGYVKALGSGDQTKMIVSAVVDQKGAIYTPSGRDLMSDQYMKIWIPKMMKDGKGRAEYSPKIQNVAEYNGDGFIFSEPVYKDGKFVGIINAVLSKNAIETTINKMLDPGMQWEWQMDEGVILKEASRLPGRILRRDTNIAITPESGWKIVVTRTQLPSPFWNLILAVGVIVSFVIYTAVYGLSSASSRAGNLASRMTLDLQKYKLALDSASNHIIISNTDGIVVYANKSAQKLTGFSESEIIGQTPRLWGGQMSEEFYDHFWDEIKAKKHVFVGTIINKRKNGELYTAQATVSPIISEDGELIGFVGVEEDVTQEKKEIQEKEENLNKLAKFNELMLGREMKMVELKAALRKAEGENAKV